jgi:lysophospholipase L1-like esterase
MNELPRATLASLAACAALSACSGGGSGPVAALPPVIDKSHGAPGMAATATPVPTATPKAAPATAATATPNPSLRIAFLGDSWMAGVGVANRCYPRPTMDATPCNGGQSIADDIAATLGATAYQNVALGGALVIDAVTQEVPLIDPSATLVVAMIGYNDERPIGDGHDLWVYWSDCDPQTRTYFPALSGNASCGFNEPYTVSAYAPGGFSETPPDMFTRMVTLVNGIHRQAPAASVFLVDPAQITLNPINSWSPTQVANFDWSYGLITQAIATQRGNVNGILDLGTQSVYGTSYYVPSGTCPTPNIGDCGGHPNAVGASAMAAYIAGGLP